MKIGVVSDVHNHVEALEYALEQLRDCDLLLSLGDLVSDFRVDPRVLRLAADARILGIAGNHEKGILLVPGSKVRARLAQEELDFLEALPARRDLHVDGHQIAVAHGSPWDDPNHYRCVYIYPDDGAALARAAADTQADIVLLGHTHVPMAVRIAKTLVFNPGTCGEPRGRDSQLTYGQIDTRAGHARVFAVRPGAAPEEILRAEL